MTREASGTVTLLDGPLGTELEARGIATPLPLWSAAAVRDAPDAVRGIHQQYARAGADVHTTATFRTTSRALAQAGHERAWEQLARRAVELCKQGAGSGPATRIAGSMAPLEDCWHPERTPAEATCLREHGELARVLAGAGVDLLLVETMPTLGELICATRAAAATGLPVWSAITLGPRGDDFSPQQVVAAASAAAAEGASCFLINCTPAEAITTLLEQLAVLDDRPASLGAYGNALFDGHRAWSPEDYATEVAHWIDSGATVVGGCCGTGPEHIAALRQLIDGRT